MSDTSRFLTRCFFSEWFFDFSSYTMNFLFLRHFIAFFPCDTSWWFPFDCPTSFTMHDTSISIFEWKLKRFGFRGYFISPHQETYFFLAFLFRLFSYFASRHFTAFFNGLLSTSSILDKIVFFWIIHQENFRLHVCICRTNRCGIPPRLSMSRASKYSSYSIANF